MLDDLRKLSPAIDDALKLGRLQANANVDLRTRIVARNVDFALVDPLVRGPLNAAKLCIEHKTIMAAHGKARKNRLGDFTAYASHVHNHSDLAIAGATLTVNCSPSYRNPDEWAHDVPRETSSFQKVLHDTVELFRSLPPRERRDDPRDQPEAVAIILVSYDGRAPARLVEGGGVLSSTDALSYGPFCHRLAKLFEDRFPRSSTTSSL